MKLSIIIPAYNAEKYIETCLNSCCKQDIAISDYEIIVVNDGSTDRTEQIVMGICKRHRNILLKYQENKGNGAARNTGVKYAQGDYLLFLDADDYIAINTLGRLIKLIALHNLDLLGFSSINVKDSNKNNSLHAVDHNITLDKILSGIDFLGTYNYKAEVWWYVIKSEFYFESGANFYNRKFVQDSYFTPTLFIKARRTAYINLDVHRYRKSTNSITRNKSKKHLDQHFQDLSFSVEKLYHLRNALIQSGSINQKTVQRLHVKQQRYVFIIIVRFIKSNLEVSYLKKMLESFKTLEAYPMDKFMSLPDYKSLIYLMLTYIFNRKHLLYPAIKIYRFIHR